MMMNSNNLRQSTGRTSFASQVLLQSTEKKETLRFETEVCLVEEFTKQMATSGYHIYHEFDSSYGIADVVLFRRSNRSEDYSNLASLPERWAYTLRRLPYRKIFSTAEFASHASITSLQARKLLATMCSAGYLRPSNTPEHWVKFRQPQPITNEIIAIEAKLSKWKSALSQALRYRHFSHQSWVLLDGKARGGAIDNIQEFQRFNIGLISIDCSGHVAIHFCPIRHQPKSPQLFWLANVRLANYIVL